MNLQARHDATEGTVDLFLCDSTSYAQLSGTSPTLTIEQHQGEPKPMLTFSTEAWDLVLGHMAELLAVEWPIEKAS